MNDKLEAARCLTQEVIHIFQDKILTNDEDVKHNLWLDSVSTHYIVIIMAGNQPNFLGGFGFSLGIHIPNS